MAEISRQVLVIGLEDRPGAVHGVAEVFSGRGLQMEAFYGTDDPLTGGGNAQALILFRATAERAELVRKVLQRLSSVRSAELWPFDDPRLVLSVLVQAGITAPEGIELVNLSSAVALAAGSPPLVAEWLSGPHAPVVRGAWRLEALTS